MKVWGVKGSLENLRKLIQCCQMLKIITRVLGSWLSGRQSRWSVAMCREWWIWWWIVSHIVKEAWKAEMGGWRWFVRLLGKDEVTMVVVEEKGGGRRIATRKMERWKDFHSRQLNCSVQSQEDLFLSNGLIMIWCWCWCWWYWLQVKAEEGLMLSSSHGLVTDPTWKCRPDHGSNFLPPIRLLFKPFLKEDFNFSFSLFL